uniref:Serine protease n=1 Tax=Panagrolaimus davidi TaxID=227884 RepID=A0A914PDB0_9BILA
MVKETFNGNQILKRGQEVAAGDYGTLHGKSGHGDSGSGLTMIYDDETVIIGVHVGDMPVLEDDILVKKPTNLRIFAFEQWIKDTMYTSLMINMKKFCWLFK